MTSRTLFRKAVVRKAVERKFSRNSRNLVLQVLWAEALTAFVLDYVFKDGCIVNNVGK